MFLGYFWAYVGQPQNHIGWATSMPFASINPTNPRTYPWNFHKKILRIGRVEKLSFFCFIPMKISHKLCVRIDGTQFLLLWWFTAQNEGGNHIIAWVYYPQEWKKGKFNLCAVGILYRNIILCFHFEKFRLTSALNFRYLAALHEQWFYNRYNLASHALILNQISNSTLPHIYIKV